MSVPEKLSSEALTVAADIDVTDNCFCSVFFAGLYLRDIPKDGCEGD